MVDTIEERLQNVSPENRRRAKGYCGTPLEEDLPRYIEAENEKVIQGGNNTYIVFGRDRLGGRSSGYGGEGAKNAGAIDIVVGRHVNNPNINMNERPWVDPNVRFDAARLYLSSKCDIDDNLGLVKGSIGNDSGMSTALLISDNTRILGRNGIKLITRPYTKSTEGKHIEKINGIDLIAGNNDNDLQPIPVGNNLKDAVEDILKHLDKLNGIVDGMLNFQMTLNEQLTNHIHISPFFGLPTSPSPTVVPAGINTMVNHLSQIKRSILMNKLNINMAKEKFTNQTSPRYILSRYNNTN
jgi:hypothetical protein